MESRLLTRYLDSRAFYIVLFFNVFFGQKNVNSNVLRSERSCRVTRCRVENLGPRRSLICSIGDVFGGCTRFCVFSSGGGFGFLFEKMSKLRGVENAHTWRHMVRLTQRSTSGSLG